MPRASGAVLSRDTRQVHRAQIVDYMHDCAYTVRSMADDAEWDPRKAAANLKNHGVDFADAATVLHDEQAITVRDDEGTRNVTSQSAWTHSEMCSLSSTPGAANDRASYLLVKPSRKSASSTG